MEATLDQQLLMMLEGVSVEYDGAGTPAHLCTMLHNIKW